MNRIVRLSVPSTRVALALALALAALGCSGASAPVRPASLAARDYGYTRAYMSWLIEKEMGRTGAVGASIALVDDDQVVWSRGFGFADKERRRAADGDTVYAAGSISKLFTAVAAMQLVEQGKLDLDRPLSDALPEFSVRSRFTDAAPVTLRTLLTHHSGLPSDYSNGFFWRANPPADWEQRYLSTPSLVKDDYLLARPGETFAYCNLGYSMAGAAVAKASGEAYADRVERTILAPLGMRTASFHRSPAILERLAQGYHGGKPVAAGYLRDTPAGGLFASVNDLAQFVKMVLADGRGPSGAVLQPATLKAMLTAQDENAPLDGEFRIGLGFWLNSAGAKPQYAAHGGDIPPFHGMLVTLPNEKLGVVVLTNSDEGAAFLMSAALKTLELAVEAKTGAPLPAPAPEPATVAADQLPREGIYTSMTGPGRLWRVDNGAKAELFGHTLRLVPRTDGRYGLQFKLLGLIPVAGEALAPMSLRFGEVGGRQVYWLYMHSIVLAAGERIEGAPLTDAWRARLGRYEITNAVGDRIFDDVRLEYDDDAQLLIIKLRHTLVGAEIAQALRPLTDDEAVSLGLGREAGATFRVLHANGEERLAFSGYELRRVR